MLLPSPQQQLDVTRADFLTNEFRRFVAQKGLYIQWEQNIACPCNIKSGDAGLDLFEVVDVDDSISFNPSCTACNGKGVIRHSSQQIQAIVTEAKGDYKTEKFGTGRIAGAKFSLLPEHLPSFGDRFRLIHSHIIQQEIITSNPNANNLDFTKHPIAVRRLELAGGPTDISILSLFITNADGTTNPTQPTLGVDYALTDNGSGLLGIDWSLGIANGGLFPQSGQTFSVAYYSNPIYTVTSDPHTLRDTNLRLNAQEIPTSMIVQCEARLEML